MARWAVTDILMTGSDFMELWLWSCVICLDVDTIIVFFICPPQLRPASASVGLRWSTQSQQRSSTISCHTRPGATWPGMKDAARGWRGGPSNCCSSPAQKEYRYSITVTLPEGEKAQIRSLCLLMVSSGVSEGIYINNVYRKTSYQYELHCRSKVWDQ